MSTVNLHASSITFENPPGVISHSITSVPADNAIVLAGPGGSGNALLRGLVQPSGALDSDAATVGYVNLGSVVDPHYYVSNTGNDANDGLSDRINQPVPVVAGQ